MNSGTATAKQRRRRIATIAGATTVLVIGVSVTAAQAWPSHGGRSGRDRAPSATAPTATAAASATATPASTATTQPSATVSATGSSSTTTSTTTAPANDTAVKQGDVIANLFEWNWASVGKECTTVLGPNGYGGVQVSPPQDSIKLGGSNHPWWEVYQPAGYELNSRMGDEAQFKAMVQTCRDAGVKVYVDAVINHMTGADAGSPKSYSGNAYTPTNYPGLYSKDDFHQASDCPTASGTVEDYDNVQQVHFCRLSNLEDLKTESTYVRSAIDGYLNKLIGYGVSGFRVDAAKHIPLADLKAIVAGLDQTVDGTAPYMAYEVFGGKGELSQAAYTDLGSVLGLDASVTLKKAFTGNIASLKTFGSGMIASDKALNFVMNHDTDRSGDSLSYKDKATNRLATQFLLADGYGRAQVYSSFAWAAKDDSPPSASSGLVSDTNCDSSAWDCLDRDPAVLGMVAFRSSVGDAALKNWSDDGANLVAFSRGTAGWTALNNGSSAKTQSFTTGLAAGTYCDLTTGGIKNNACAGTTVKVGTDGKAQVTVPSKGAVAITQDSLL